LRMDTSSSSLTPVSTSSERPPRADRCPSTQDNRPTLYVRRPGNDIEEVHAFHDDDPFLSEMATFIDTAATGKAKLPILSSYADGEHDLSAHCCVALTVL
jgi:hypothetical protein